MVYIGLDIGGTSLKAGFVDENGEIDELETVSWGKNRTGETMIAKSIQHMHKLLKKAREKNILIKGIGISATGQIKNPEGFVVGSAGHIPLWIGTRIREVFEKESGLPVTVENDANCAVIAEHWGGSGKKCSNILMYTIGTGIGGGIIINNQLLRGTAGIAGEIGHMTLDYDGQKCHCGMQGCFEKLASMTAFVEQVKKLKNRDVLTGQDIFEYIGQKDTEVLDVYHQFLNYHVAAITSLLHLFNPELIIIGGGISEQEELLIDAISSLVFKSAMPAFTDGLRIESAQLKNGAGIVGAVKNFMEEKSYENTNT